MPSYSYEPMTIGVIFYHMKTNKINTSPDYQREIVWDSEKQRKLIDTLLKNFPILPAILIIKNPHDIIIIINPNFPKIFVVIEDNFFKKKWLLLK